MTDRTRIAWPWLSFTTSHCSKCSTRTSLSFRSWTIVLRGGRRGCPISFGVAGVSSCQSFGTRFVLSNQLRSCLKRWQRWIGSYPTSCSGIDLEYSSCRLWLWILPPVQARTLLLDYPCPVCGNTDTLDHLCAIRQAPVPVEQIHVVVKPLWSRTEKRFRIDGIVVT